MEEAEVETADVQRDKPEYQVGRSAFQQGFEEDTCPYPKGDGRRVGWFTGFFDARTSARIGPFLAKYGMSFP